MSDTTRQAPCTVPPIIWRRPRHDFGDTRTRCWIRSKGRILRFIVVTDYSVCGPDRGPNTFMKRLTHKRWPRGHHMCKGKYDPKYAAWYEQLDPGQWYDISGNDAPRSVSGGSKP